MMPPGVTPADCGGLTTRHARRRESVRVRLGARCLGPSAFGLVTGALIPPFRLLLSPPPTARAGGSPRPRRSATGRCPGDHSHASPWGLLILSPPSLGPRLRPSGVLVAASDAPPAEADSFS